MKKIIFSVFALFGMTLASTAQTLSVANIDAAPGQTVTASLNFECQADYFSGFLFSMQFPQTGFTVEEDALGGIQSPVVGSMTNGFVKFSGASKDNFASTVSFTVTFTVAEDVESGSYDVTVADVQLDHEGSLVDVEGVTFKVNVNNYVTIDENSETAPKAFSTSGDVKVKRTVTSGEWSTICLPFGMSADLLKNAFGDSYELAYLSGYEVEKDESDNITGLKVAFTKRTSALVANTPYIIKASKDVTEFVVSNKTISVKDVIKTDVTKEDDETGDVMTIASMIGTLAAKTVVPANSLFLSDNKFWYSTGNTKMKGLRAYFTFNDILSSVASSRIKFSVSDGDTQTEIQIPELMPNDGEYYNLNGLRVDTPSKGIYIKNGKKVVVK